MGLQNPIAIIPNGIDLPELQTPNSELPTPPWQGHIPPGNKVLLFLSRIHPKKGLPNLLRAWKSAVSGDLSRGPVSQWTLAIAGWDQGGHEAELKRLCDELEVKWADVRTGRTTGQQDRTTSVESVVGGQPSNTHSAEVTSPLSVVFLGPQFKESKAACYRNCDAFILPSFSEGLPMVVLEAWAYGKPVIMTPECNLPEGFAAEAAVRIQPETESIVSGLNLLFDTPDAQRARWGEAGMQLARERFSWHTIAGQLKDTYLWMLGGGSRPSWVRID
jgi:poly(glycerol-phosphate) alpha-glucosyltransferase